MHALSTAAGSFLLAAAAMGQACPPSQTLLVNDNLPAAPSGLQSFAVIQGLCDGEAAAAVFDTTTVASAVKVDLAAVAYGGTAQGVQAAVNLRLFDGVTFGAGGVPVLGPMIFDYAATTGASIGVTSTAVNTQDISAFNVVASSGKLVVAWVMQFNGDPAGSCATGYPHNLMTDYGGGLQLTCDPNVTPPQKNLVYVQGQGWLDVTQAVVSGVPLCPFFYSGNWIIRACVEPAPGTQNPFQVTVSPSPVPAGSTAVLTFVAPGQAGNTYVAAPAFTTSPPLNIPGAGSLPLNPADPLFTWFLTSGDPLVSQIFVNFSGTIGTLDQATALVQTPAGIGPLQVFVAFVCFDGTGAVTAVSDAGLVDIL